MERPILGFGDSKKAGEILNDIIPLVIMAIMVNFDVSGISILFDGRIL